MNPANEGRLFLKSYREDGLQEIYVAPGPKTAGAKAPDPPEPPPGARQEMLALREIALRCTLCDVLARHRQHVVFGSGNIRAQVVFVGEAPGRDEDAEGLPFVGMAGRLLTKIIESIGLARKDVFICNVLKCRPPQNRTPRPEEILNCEPYLVRQIELIRPKIICALGTFAAQTLLKTGSPISQLRGRPHDFKGIPVLCTYHPAYLLRNPEEKKKVWEDMKSLRKFLAHAAQAEDAQV